MLSAGHSGPVAMGIRARISSPKLSLVLMGNVTLAGEGKTKVFLFDMKVQRHSAGG